MLLLLLPLKLLNELFYWNELFILVLPEYYTYLINVLSPLYNVNILMLFELDENNINLL